MSADAQRLTTAGADSAAHGRTPGREPLASSCTSRSRVPAWQRYWLLALVAALGSTGYVLAKLWLSAWHHRLLDFQVYLLGAHHLDNRLYTATLSPPPHLFFTYTPFAALSFVPFTWISFQWAQLLWSLFSIASLFSILVLSLRAIRPELPQSELIVLSLALLAPAYRFEPVLLTFAYGQVNLVLCALVLADLLWKPHLAGRTLPRGVLVGLAAAVKLVPLVFVPYLFLTRQVRAAWVAIATFAACSGAAATIDPSVTWSYWTKYADDASRIGAVFYISNQSIRGVADRLAHQAVSSTVLTIASVVLLVAGLALARWSWKTSSNFLGVLVCATTGLMVSPISWAHHLVWAVPVVVWLAFGPDRPKGGVLWAIAATVFFWIAPIWKVPQGGNLELGENWWQLLVGNSFFWAMSIFLLGVTAMLTSRRRAAHVVVTSPEAHRAAT